jgi:hypothetical protein
VLPDPLTLNNGKPAKTAKDWWDKRRPEIVEYFDREIYGRAQRPKAGTINQGGESEGVGDGL